MKKLLSIAVAAAFAASSFAVVAQDKKAEKKKEDVKSASPVKSASGGAVTTATDKPKDTKGAALPTPEGKRKTEAQRTDKNKK
jgi:Ni/Co efflux regulator RcnB